MARCVGSSPISEYEVLPSQKSFKALYVVVKKQLDDLREEVKVYLTRNKNTQGDLLIESELLLPQPLVKMYDLYLELEKLKVKEQQQQFNMLLDEVANTLAKRTPKKRGRKPGPGKKQIQAT